MAIIKLIKDLKHDGEGRSGMGTRLRLWGGNETEAEIETHSGMFHFRSAIGMKTWRSRLQGMLLAGVCDD